MLNATFSAIFKHRDLVYLFRNIWEIPCCLSELQIDEFKNKREEIMLGDFFSLFFFLYLDQNHQGKFTWWSRVEMEKWPLSPLKNLYFYSQPDKTIDNFIQDSKS